MRYSKTVNGKGKLFAKCASCAGGVGVALCTVFMTLGAVGVIAIGAVRSGSMTGMSLAQPIVNPSVPQQVALFFAGFWGEALLAVSFALMLLGFWLSGRKFAVYSAIPGIVILFFGMYIQFSIALEIVGAAFIVFAYAFAYGKAIFKPQH